MLAERVDVLLKMIFFFGFLEVLVSYLLTWVCFLLSDCSSFCIVVCDYVDPYLYYEGYTDTIDGIEVIQFYSGHITYVYRKTGGSVH